MDQVRIALTWLKEQHFWVLSVLTTIAALGCWYVAAGQLSEQYADNKKAIESEFSSAERLNREPYHPNDVVLEQQEKEIEQLAEKVEQVWTRLYDRQREKVLVWPKQLDSGVSRDSDRFLKHVANKQFGEFITDRFRDRYLNYIEERFPDLPKIIQALEIDDETGRMSFDPDEMGEGMGMGRGMGMGGGYSRTGTDEEYEEPDFLVVWEDQMMVKQQLSWSARPSALKIWVTQEDLWVYETLLWAIAATNDAAQADRYSNAAVRNIYQFQVGRMAAKESRSESRIYRPTDESATSGGYGMSDFGDEGGYDMMGGGGGEEMGFGDEMGMGGTGEESEFAVLLTGRYEDDQGKPLPRQLSRPRESRSRSAVPSTNDSQCVSL